MADPKRDIKPDITPQTQAKGARKQWDKSEWSAKAKAKDEEHADRARDAEQAMKNGKRPRHGPKEDLPKPTKALEARSEDLGIDKNLGKTVLVQTATTGKGPRGAGFYCDLCNRTLKDSLSYLDHLNSRFHLARLGQTTQVTRSTLSQVRERIRQLRESTASKVTAKNYDFQSRLKEVRAGEEVERGRRREERKRQRAERREEEELGRVGVIRRFKGDKEGGGGGGEVEKAQRENEDISMMMGFGGFGGGKKR